MFYSSWNNTAKFNTVKFVRVQSRARNRRKSRTSGSLRTTRIRRFADPANKSWARSAFRLKVHGSGAHKEAGRWDSRITPWNFRSRARDPLATRSRLHSSAPRDIQARRCLLSSQQMPDTVARRKRKASRGARGTTTRTAKRKKRRRRRRRRRRRCLPLD